MRKLNVDAQNPLVQVIGAWHPQSMAELEGLLAELVGHSQVLARFVCNAMAARMELMNAGGGADPVEVEDLVAFTELLDTFLVMAMLILEKRLYRGVAEDE
jgi:hypothetical protein